MDSNHDISNMRCEGVSLCKKAVYIRKLSKVLTFVLVLISVISLVPFLNRDAYAGGGQWIDLGSGWRIRIDTPDTGKPYNHIHFQKNQRDKYCLRLDTLQPCDGFKNSTSSNVPRWVMEKAKQKAGKKWGSAISSSTISWGKVLLIAGAAILVIVMTICPFDGPAGDVVAWGLLLGSI